ncbi:MAG: hypothetical protein ACFN27_05185, partial [Prevotella sp.]
LQFLLFFDDSVHGIRSFFRFLMKPVAGFASRRLFLPKTVAGFASSFSDGSGSVFSGRGAWLAGFFFVHLCLERSCL